MANLTHRKRLELDLEKSQKKYKHLFQSAHDGIVLFNQKGEIQESNLSLHRLLGYYKDELEHMKVSDLAEDTSRKILSDHLEDLQSMGFVWPCAFGYHQERYSSTPLCKLYPE